MKMKILNFKTVSPLFEMERDGAKLFSLRRIDQTDPRFRALSQWKPEYEWYIKTSNPETGESFTRLIDNVSYLYYYQEKDLPGMSRGIRGEPDWKVIHFSNMKEK